MRYLYIYCWYEIKLKSNSMELYLDIMHILFADYSVKWKVFNIY